MTDSRIRDRHSSGHPSEQYSGRGGLERYLPTLAKPIRIASFWSAIVLPFLYVPLLIGGISGSVGTVVFVCLLCSNALALYVGHSHRQSSDDR